MYFQDSRVPTRAAKRCEELLAKHFPNTGNSIPPKDFTAFVLCGFESWREMKASWTDVKAPSKLDEDDEKLFVVTRSLQTTRAQQFLAKHGVDASTELVARFVRDWQPSARHPDLDVERYFSAREKGGTGQERYCETLLGLCQMSSGLPNDEDLRLIIENIHWAREGFAERIRLMAGLVANNIVVRSKEDEKAEIGFRILRAVSLFNPYAKARLARHLSVGWSRKNHQQAWELVMEASEEDFDDDPEARLIYAELGDAAAATSASVKASPEQVSKVIRILERSADHGHWKAALYLYHYYSNPADVLDDDPDKFYSDKVAPDKEKARRYRQMVVEHPTAARELDAALAEARRALTGEPAPVVTRPEAKVPGKGTSDEGGQS
ncbi:hypothetical protein [Cupriavidus taiwanensis]|uniref:hypothetical protein n=1 Tax=Cupriavidus taiwanensis TaxID=164546 RepID=UPI000E1010E1|nr:hypothetical protein [Cupriavidus taiwanensis]SPA56709.1 conserved protein of unknown function [Cupriavidus taiwanensis]